jgi:nicotinamidase/pyrazinamidase
MKASLDSEGFSPRALDAYRDALLIVDLQPDFMPGGPLAVPDGDQVVAPIAELLKQVEGRVNTIVATQDWHPPGHVSFASRHGRPPFTTLSWAGEEQQLWPEHCVQGTPGAELDSRLPRSPLHLILRKGTHVDADSYSAFRENRGLDGERHTTGLAALLKSRGVSRVLVCGLARDYCVAWTALDAAAAGLTVVVLDDLCRSVFPERTAETDAAFAAAGVEHVLSSEFQLKTLASAPRGAE